MEDLSSSTTNESKTAAPARKPIVKVEFVETPSYRAGVVRSSLGGQAKDGQPSPSDTANTIENSNNLNSNLLLTEEERSEQEALRTIQIITGVALLVGCGYFGYKVYQWLLTLPPN